MLFKYMYVFVVCDKVCYNGGILNVDTCTCSCTDAFYEPDECKREYSSYYDHRHEYSCCYEYSVGIIIPVIVTADKCIPFVMAADMIIPVIMMVDIYTSMLVVMTPGGVFQ